MTYCTNYIRGIMMAHWTVNHITRAFGVPAAVARMHFQCVSTPEQVNELLVAIANLAD